MLLRAAARRASWWTAGASAGQSRLLGSAAVGGGDADATTTTTSSTSAHTSPSPRRRRTAAPSRLASSPDDVYDVVILGGGMVGLAMAGEIASNPVTAHLRVLLADRSPAPPPLNPKPSTSVPAARVSTLSPATLAQLARLGAWSTLAPWSAPFDAMAVWDGSGHGAVHYTAADGELVGGLGGGLARAAAGAAAALAAAAGFQNSLPPPLRGRRGSHAHHPAAGLLGAVAENEAIASSLLAALRAAGGGRKVVEEAWACGGLAGLELPPASPSASSTTPLATVHFGDRPSVRARLVVGADGAGSAARSAAGLRVVEKSYGRLALVGTVAYGRGTPPSAARTAYQAFLAGGPLALLPLRGGHASVVWTLPPADAAKLLQACRADAGSPAGPLASAVDAALRAGNPAAGGTWPGRAAAPPPPRVTAPAGPSTPTPAAFPLRLRFAPAWARPRFALVGDAAHAIHPLAGQGVNLGFADAAALGHAIAAAVAAGGDVGALSPTLTTLYSTPRRAAAAAWVAALDGLAAAFEPQAGLAAAMRGAGLRAVAAAGPLRAAIVKFASGGEV